MLEFSEEQLKECMKTLDVIIELPECKIKKKEFNKTMTTAVKSLGDIISMMLVKPLVEAWSESDGSLQKEMIEEINSQMEKIRIVLEGTPTDDEFKSILADYSALIKTFLIEPLLEKFKTGDGVRNNKINPATMFT